MAASCSVLFWLLKFLFLSLPFHGVIKNVFSISDSLFSIWTQRNNKQRIKSWNAQKHSFSSSELNTTKKQNFYAIWFNICTKPAFYLVSKANWALSGCIYIAGKFNPIWSCLCLCDLYLTFHVRLNPNLKVSC